MSDYIPQALVLEILSRLPPKTLVRCTLVCKAWNTIIKSHTFVSSHLQKSLSNPSLCLLLIRHVPKLHSNGKYLLCSTGAYGLCKIAKLRYPFPISHGFGGRPRFVDTINGVICVYNEILNFVLWNPFIQRHIQLPRPLCNTRQQCYWCMLGFGFDSKKNDFKVVRICYCRGRDDHSGEVPPMVELYSLNEGAWRIIDASIFDVIRIVSHNNTQCFSNGNVHWHAYEGHADDSFNYFILRFNVEEENFKKIRLPPELSSLSFDESTISVINGCLSILEYVYRQTSVNIWMQRESESWSKMYSINLQCGVYKAFAPRTSDEIFVVPRGQSIGGSSLHLFEPKREKMTNLGIQDITNTPYVCKFTQSLALFDRENDAICSMNRSYVEWVQVEELEE